MNATALKLTFQIPYRMKGLRPEVKTRGGQYNSEDQTWTLDDNENNRALVEKMSSTLPMSTAPQEARVRAVAQTAAELLSALKIGNFVLIEASPTRVVIEKGPKA